MPRKKFDAPGVGLNSTDRFCVVSRHPAGNAGSRILETAREGGAEEKGARDALACDGERFCESPDLRADVLDTTEAGDALPRLDEVKAFLRAHAS